MPLATHDVVQRAEATQLSLPEVEPKSVVFHAYGTAYRTHGNIEAAGDIVDTLKCGVVDKRNVERDPRDRVIDESHVPDAPLRSHSVNA